MDLDLSRFRHDQPPVVLVGGLNLVRALGLGGLDAIVATWDPDEPALASRHCTGRRLLPRPGADGATVEALMKLGAELSGRVGRRIPLMYGSDGALTLVQAHRERLQRYFRFLMPDPDVASALVAKDRFGAFARHRGLPVPRSLAWEGDGPGSVRGTEGPVLVKPSDKVDWHQSTLCQRLFDGDGKARVFPSGIAACEHPLVQEFHRKLTFQEYVPGGDATHWSFHGFADESGHVLASFVGRKLRTFPVGAGESAFIELAHEPTLEILGRELATRCPLRGLFKMDFKQDPRDGSWQLLEINARASLWLRLGAANGINLTRVAYDYLVHGLRPAAVPVRNDYRWLALGLDYRAFREMRSRGELGPVRWVASILASRNIYNLFSWSDPGPWLALWRGRLGRHIARAPRRVSTLLATWRSTAS